VVEDDPTAELVLDGAADEAGAEPGLDRLRDPAHPARAKEKPLMLLGLAAWVMSIATTTARRIERRRSSKITPVDKRPYRSPRSSP
jgi:hypothetical protein